MAQSGDTQATHGKSHIRLLSMLADARQLLFNNNTDLESLLSRLFGPEPANEITVGPPITAGHIAGLNEEILAITSLLKFQQEVIKRITDEI